MCPIDTPEPLEIRIRLSRINPRGSWAGGAAGILASLPLGAGVLTLEGRSGRDASSPGSPSRSPAQGCCLLSCRCRGHVSGRGQCDRACGAVGSGSELGALRCLCGKEPEVVGAPFPHWLLLRQGGPGQFGRSPAASGQASFLLWQPWQPRAGTPLTRAEVRVELAWQMKPDLEEALGAGGVKPLLGGPSRMGAGLPQWRAGSPSQPWSSRPQMLNPLPDFAHWLDTPHPQAPCQALWKAALGGLVGPQLSFSVVRWGPQVLLACPSETATRAGRSPGHSTSGAEAEGHVQLGTEGAHTACGGPAGWNTTEGPQTSWLLFG
ncbi:unnamed protein product [Nyctereutes procyonoides]|uniref:(raccoon dog) hypothetical protein n=1 Tax=Nyctereutes procyonoides TaxID=34880 RepID=A0A811Z5A9_NYCPR|nr:unnamed protein product [Nyctereutes procyonoides]